MKPLKKGVVLPDFKDRSLLTTQIYVPSPSRFLNISLDQHVGAPVRPCIQEGDPVFVGTKIADGLDWTSVPVHSSVSGHVAQITQDSILIESDEADRLDASIQTRPQIPSDPDALVEIIREAGIVDLGGSALPVHGRLVEARAKGVETLILNGCESEPFLTCDHLLMLNHPVEILKGAELLRVACGAKRAIIAVERNKLEVVEILNSKNYNLKIETVGTAALPVRYPQGSERALVKTFTPSPQPSPPRRGRGKGEGGSALSKGILVEHVATAFAVYEAVYLKKPLYERVVTVGGPCILEPKNLWARIGTRAVDLVRSSKGFMREPDRVIFGGPMTGVSIEHLEIPITKKVQGILALSSELVPTGAEEPCIRCGACVDVCPESLVPETIIRAVKKTDRVLAKEYEIDACTECGSCAYVCPSKIKIVAIIREGKNGFAKKSPHAEPAHAFSLYA